MGSKRSWVPAPVCTMLDINRIDFRERGRRLTRIGDRVGITRRSTNVVWSETQAKQCEPCGWRWRGGGEGEAVLQRYTVCWVSRLNIFSSCASTLRSLRTSGRRGVAVLAKYLRLPSDVGVAVMNRIQLWPAQSAWIRQVVQTDAGRAGAVVDCIVVLSLVPRSRRAESSVNPCLS
jgi:hypothetical protein